MRILFLLLPIFLFSCTNQEQKPTDQKPQGIIGDYAEASRLVSPTAEKQVIETITGSKDTFVTVISQTAKSFVYYETSIDTFTKKYSGGVVTTPPTTEPPPSTGTRNNITFTALFNGSNPFDPTLLYKQACCPYSISQSKTITREGDGAFRAESRSGEQQVSGGYRPEFIPPTNTRLIDGWYGYSVYLQDWKACSGCGEHIMQWHPDNGSGSAVLAVYTEKNTFHVRLNPEGDLSAFTVKDGKQITPNKWYDFVWHVTWSKDASKGRIELWIDGEKYVDWTGTTLTMTGTPYFKIGINRWNISGVNRILYIDAVRIGNSSATYKDVAP